MLITLKLKITGRQDLKREEKDCVVSLRLPEPIMLGEAGRQGIMGPKEL